MGRVVHWGMETTITNVYYSIVVDIWGNMIWECIKGLDWEWRRKQCAELADDLLGWLLPPLSGLRGAAILAGATALTMQPLL